MKPSLICAALIAAFLATSIFSKAQPNIIQQSIYFNTAKYNIDERSKAVLRTVLDSLSNFQSYVISISGNTDNIGSTAYNDTLAARRVGAVMEYFINAGVDRKVLSATGFGENKPVADNRSADGRKRNRRVDVAISFIRAPVVAAEAPLPFISELYSKISTAPQTFCINAALDTNLVCKKGTVVFVKANTFMPANGCGAGCVTLTVKEDFLRQEMILDNLSTTANGVPLESQGMLYTDAADCNGNKLQISNGKELVIFLPVDTVIEGAKIFTGHMLPRNNALPHDSIMNWTVSNNVKLSNFSLQQLNMCGDWLCGTSNVIRCTSCSFFFCRIGRLGKALKGLISKGQHLNNVGFRQCQQSLSQQGNFIGGSFGGTNSPAGLVKAPPPDLACGELEKLYKQYGVTNLPQLILALNKQLLDSFEVKTIVELEDTLLKLKNKKIELEYINKKISYTDFNYYVFNSPRLGWSNVDRFASMAGKQLVTMRINLRPEQNTDCKLVFRRRRMILPATSVRDSYMFEGVPAGEDVWIVAVKYLDNQPYISVTPATITNSSFDVSFKQVTLDELKEQLKMLDK